MVEKSFGKSVVDNGGNRKNEPFENAVVKFHQPNAFVQSNNKEECDESVKKVLLFYLWQETAKEIFAKRRCTNSNDQNINDPGNCTLNEIFIQS